MFKDYIVFFTNHVCRYSLRLQDLKLNDQGDCMLKEVEHQGFMLQGVSRYGYQEPHMWGICLLLFSMNKTCV